MTIVISSSYFFSKRKASPSLGYTWNKGVPIEVLPLAYKPIIGKIQALYGGEPILRLAKSKAVSTHWHPK